jgi:hypothetical protein
MQALRLRFKSKKDYHESQKHPTGPPGRRLEGDQLADLPAAFAAT